MQPAGRAVNKPLALQSTTPISPYSPISFFLSCILTDVANITHKIMGHESLPCVEFLIFKNNVAN